MKIFTFCFLLLWACSGRAADIPVYDYIVKKVFPHDIKSFTEGLIIEGDTVYESSGGNGTSYLRKTALASGRVLAEQRLPEAYFGEGIAAFGGELVCLTWTSQTGLVFDLRRLAWKRNFAYAGEGWGAASDARHVYVSNGSSRIRVLDGKTLKPVRDIEVTMGTTPLARLNELEMVGTELFANIWKTDLIARIDVRTGKVVGWIDLTGLLKPALRRQADVLNGIAYDRRSQRLFVTGKNWPQLFQIALRKRTDGRRGPAFDALNQAGDATPDPRVLGTTAFRMSSYFSDVGDVSALSILHLAQLDYVRRHFQVGQPGNDGLPLISMIAPGKNGGAGFTDVQPGALRRAAVVDLYKFPNTLNVVRITGAELRAWLEKGAERFRTIDPARATPQELVDSAVDGTSFDTAAAEELHYEINLARPPGQRIERLLYRQRALSDGDEVLVVTNNFRVVGGGNFRAIAREKVVFAPQVSQQDVLAAYIETQQVLTRARHGTLKSWRFAKMEAAGPVIFHAPPGLLALARDSGLSNVQEAPAQDQAGPGAYAIDLAQ
ncbi:hypothetical protein HF313_26010 [Massilia atriviolacea]|uniref:5'-Nucleotidase C-terminal domain-containing protein n=1 Tax=Massilia atriviolacea TaxID=2495579 RepID=A0A430HMZ7_9BURK|nr:glutaminyl-peptide cyclotransferase [Massilia atriviolacea]RSZ58880.1 hypothetical protein EJB06_11085 [Massilia atriviolacea]